MIDRIEEVLGAMQSDPSPSVREAAAAALERLRAKRSIAWYLQKVRTGSLEERMRAVFAAEEIGGSEGLAVLLAAIADPEPQVRGAAVRALGSFPTVPVLKALVERLPEEQGVVLGNLLETLGRSRRKELAPIIEKYLGHPDADVNGKAIVGYGLVAGTDGLGKILAQAGAASETVRVAVARALGEWSENPAGKEK